MNVCVVYEDSRNVSGRTGYVVHRLLALRNWTCELLFTIKVLLMHFSDLSQHGNKPP